MADGERYTKARERALQQQEARQRAAAAEAAAQRAADAQAQARSAAEWEAGREAEALALLALPRAETAEGQLEQLRREAETQSAFFVALQTLDSLCRNAAGHPGEAKYRSVRLSNETLVSRLLVFRAGATLLRLAGFAPTPGTDTARLPDGEAPCPVVHAAVRRCMRDGPAVAELRRRANSLRSDAELREVLESCDGDLRRATLVLQGVSMRPEAMASEAQLPAPRLANRPWVHEVLALRAHGLLRRACPRLEGIARELAYLHTRRSRAVSLRASGGDLTVWRGGLAFPECTELHSGLAHTGELLLEVRLDPHHPTAPPRVRLVCPRLTGAANLVAFNGVVSARATTAVAWGRRVHASPPTPTPAADMLDSLAVELQISGAAVEPGPRRSYELPDKTREPQWPPPLPGGFSATVRLAAAVPASEPPRRRDGLWLPHDTVRQLYGDDPGRLLLFELRTERGRRAYVALGGTDDRLPSGTGCLPAWLSEELGIDVGEGDTFSVCLTALRPLSSLTVQPHDGDFEEAVSASGQPLADLLQKELRRLSCLTEGLSVPVDVPLPDGGCRTHMLHVLSCDPDAAVRLVDSDPDAESRFEVRLARPPGAESAAEAEARRADAAERAREWDAALADAQRKAARGERARAEAQLPPGLGRSGSITVQLRFPDGEKLQGSFEPAADLSPLRSFAAFCSRWGQESGLPPAGVSLSCAVPGQQAPRALDASLHRQMLNVSPADTAADPGAAADALAGQLAETDFRGRAAPALQRLLLEGDPSLGADGALRAAEEAAAEARAGTPPRRAVSTK